MSDNQRVFTETRNMTSWLRCEEVAWSQAHFKETNKGIFKSILIWLIWFLFQKLRALRTSSESSCYLSKQSILRQLNNQWNMMEFVFQIYNVWFSCLLVSKLEILNLFISMGNLQFQIWVSDQSKNGFVYFYWLFAALPCVISDILIECIGFLENFTKLSEKSYGTTYFINKIEKTFSYWLQNFADNLTRPGTKRFTQDSADCGWRRWWQGAIITFTVARMGRSMLAQWWWPCLAHWRCWHTPYEKHGETNASIVLAAQCLSSILW